MADEKKYKLGNLEFNTEQEYKAAAADLTKIRELMGRYNVNDAEQAKKILDSFRSHPDAFKSPYGRKFIEKLEKAAGSAPVKNSDGGQPQPESAQKQKKTKEKKRTKAPKKEGKQKLQIFTVRNFVVGIIIIAAVIALSLFAPQLFSPNNSKSGSGDIQRNMVTAYAKGQAELKAQLYTYYFDVMGESEDEAKQDAKAGITDNYVLDLSDSTISRMSASEIEKVYKQLVDGGDIQNNSFVEPTEVTVLKDKMTSAGLSGNSGNGTQGETSVNAVVNSMMDYQERLYFALCYNYSLLSYQQADSEAFAAEDMESIFGDVIYTYDLSDDEKETYYQNFVDRGLISENRIVRISTNPQDYNLPDLTPAIEVALGGEKAKAYHCSMINYAPAASVFYEFHSRKESGYLCFRNNGKDTKYVQLDDGTSVTVQGDFYMINGKDFVAGEWFYNKENIGLLLNGEHDNIISCVNDLTY